MSEQTTATQWTASIAYTEQNAILLAKTIRNTFHFKQKLLLLGLSVAVIAAGFLIGLDSGAGMLSLAFGCIMLMNTDAGVRFQARQTVRQLKGYVPKMRYTFREDGFLGTAANEEHLHAYSSLIRLVDAKAFLYLFQNKTSGFMVDRATVEPREVEALKAWIARQAGIEWTKPGNLLTAGLLTLIFNRKNTKKQG